MIRPVGLLLCSALCLSATTVTLNFEGFPDSTILSNQYAGVTFGNAIILGAGISLNEFEFPPHSGSNVVSDDGGPVSIAFATPVVSFSGYFTYAEPLTLQAFDNSNTQVDLAMSAFSSNMELSGDLGSNPNEFLQLTFMGGISGVTITGDPSGGSFALDDAIYTTSVPESGGTVLAFMGLLVVWLARQRTAAGQLNKWSSLIRLFLCGRVIRQLTGLAALSFLSSEICAAQSVSAPTASQVAVYLNEISPITITARVASDPALIPGSVTLVRVNQSGQTVGTFGTMYDDGTHGDVIPGDGNFTLQVTLTEPLLENIGLVTTAAYKGQLLRIKSPVTFIPVVVHQSDADAQQNMATADAGAAFFEARALQIGNTQAAHDLITFLIRQPGVQDAVLSSDNSSVNIIFSDGLEAVILTSPAGTLGGGSQRPGSIRQRSHRSAASFAASSCGISPLALSALSITNSTVAFPLNNAAIVLSPFKSEAGDTEATSIADSLSATCAGPAKVMVDAQVTVNVIKTLSQYGIVSIVSHSGLVRPVPADPNAPTGYVEFSTGQQAALPTSADLMLHWSAKLICPVHHHGSNLFYWGILPAFIRWYSFANHFPNSVIYIASCGNLKNSTLANAFLNNGALVYLGFEDTVYVDDANVIGNIVFSTLSDQTLALEDRTVEKAFAKTEGYSFTDPKTGKPYPESIFGIVAASAGDVALCVPQVSTQSVLVECTSSGQLCSPAYSTTVDVPQPLPVTIQYTTATTHCSSIRVHIYLDGAPVTTSAFLGPGESTGPIALGKLPTGVHGLALQAEGKLGGCNVGNPRSWAGTLTIDVP